ncbi:hypothetical protein ACWCXL_12215 [Streptomyces sp. NPDC001588]
MRQQTVDALVDAYADRVRALQRVLWLIAHHADLLATDPTLALRALDAGPTACDWCPPDCSGDCTPDPAVMARLRAAFSPATEAQE